MTSAVETLTIHVEVHMSRRIRLLGLGGVLVLVGGCSDMAPTAPAAAENTRVLAQTSGKPSRSPLPANAFVVPAGLACSFELAFDPLVNRVVSKTFPPEANGEVVQLNTGTLIARLTNVGTGESITVNVSGPSRVTFHTDGLITVEGWGHGLLFLTPTDVPAGPTAVLTSGRVVFNITPTGQLIVVSQSGHQEDACAALS